MPAVHEILSDFNEIVTFTKSYVNEIKYYGQHNPGTTKLTSLFLSRKTALVLANPEVRWKNKKKQHAKPKIKAEKEELNIQKERQNKSLFCPGSKSSKV